MFGGSMTPTIEYKFTEYFCKRHWKGLLGRDFKGVLKWSVSTRVECGHTEK